MKLSAALTLLSAVSSLAWVIPRQADPKDVLYDANGLIWLPDGIEPRAGDKHKVYFCLPGQNCTYLVKPETVTGQGPKGCNNLKPTGRFLNVWITPDLECTVFALPNCNKGEMDSTGKFWQTVEYPLFGWIDVLEDWWLDWNKLFLKASDKGKGPQSIQCKTGPIENGELKTGGKGYVPIMDRKV